MPAHPIAGAECSGPDAGFATLFQNRWCILTPERADESAVEKLSAFWIRMGAMVERMSAQHHDLVLAVTSHLPHLIAYNIVRTADDLGEDTRSEVFSRTRTIRRSIIEQGQDTAAPDFGRLRE